MTAKVIALRPRPRGADEVIGDEALAAAAATGDPAAVGALFDRFHQKVARFLGRVVGVGPDVDDLVQATFLVVAGGRARFDGRAKASTWLFGIAANVARHHKRSAGRRRRLQEVIDRTASFFSPSRHAEDAVDARRVVARVERALASQPIDRRLAFVMCEVEGLSAREAAIALDSTEAAVWKRVSDVRRALRGALDEEGTS